MLTPIRAAKLASFPAPPKTISARRAIAYALLSGALLILCFPHADLGFVAWIALIPFLKTFPHAKTRVAFGRGFACGWAFFGGLLYWVAVFTQHVIGGLGILAWLIFSGREALWVGLFAVLANFVWNRTSALGRIFVIPSLWTIVEWGRQLGTLGLGWGDLGYTQWHALPVIQVASVTGVWGLSWLIVFVNIALASAKRQHTLLAGAVFLGVWMCGFVRLRHPLPRPTTVAASLQADLDENVPWLGRRPEDPAYFTRTLQVFDELAQKAHQQGATICVTAETSTPGYPRTDPDLLARLASIAVRNHVTLVIGAWDSDPATSRSINAVMTITPEGRLTGVYAKQQLVPFGEYVPFRSLFPFLESFHVLSYDDLPGGPNQMPMIGGAGERIGSGVCYESTYPRFLRKQVARGATYDVVVTDDTWFGKTAAARQHLAMSAIRAVETDRYLIRAAQTGISAVFDPRGREVAELGLFKRGALSASVAPRTDRTFFVRYGDWFVGLCGVMVVLPLLGRLAGVRRRKTYPLPSSPLRKGEG